MTATVIPFPRKTRTHQVSPAGFPDHWTSWDEHFYEHFQRCDGLNPKEAWSRVEQGIADKREADALLPGEDKLLFLARLAMSRLPRR